MKTNFVLSLFVYPATTLSAYTQENTVSSILDIAIFQDNGTLPYTEMAPENIKISFTSTNPTVGTTLKCAFINNLSKKLDAYVVASQIGNY